VALGDLDLRSFRNGCQTYSSFVMSMYVCVWACCEALHRCEFDCASAERSRLEQSPSLSSSSLMQVVSDTSFNLSYFDDSPECLFKFALDVCTELNMFVRRTRLLVTSIYTAPHSSLLCVTLAVRAGNYRLVGILLHDAGSDNHIITYHFHSPILRIFIHC
jgi:hypothetical protein